MCVPLKVTNNFDAVKATVSEHASRALTNPDAVPHDQTSSIHRNSAEPTATAKGVSSDGAGAGSARDVVVGGKEEVASPQPSRLVCVKYLFDLNFNIVLCPEFQLQIVCF